MLINWETARIIEITGDASIESPEILPNVTNKQLAFQLYYVAMCYTIRMLFIYILFTQTSRRYKNTISFKIDINERYSGATFFWKRNVAIPLRSVPTEIETFLFGFRSTFPSHLLGDPVAAAGENIRFTTYRTINWCTTIHKKSTGERRKLWYCSFQLSILNSFTGNLKYPFKLH